MSSFTHIPKAQSSRKRRTHLKPTMYAQNVHYFVLEERLRTLALTEETTITFLSSLTL